MAIRLARPYGHTIKTQPTEPMSLSTLETVVASGLDVCIVQCGRLLSVRWWFVAVGGGYPEVQALRLVCKVSLSALARANGCHLPEDNHKLAKAMMGHVCFDAAMEAAAHRLQSEWAICGGYALSCLTRSTEPHAKYKYVEQIYSSVKGKVTKALWQSPHGSDQTFGWGDVDFFLINTVGMDGGAPWEWTARMSRMAVRNAIAVLTECLAIVAGYGNQFGPAYDPACFFCADMVDRGYFGGIRNFQISHHLLGRKQAIQLVISTDPSPSALMTVLGFDMTQCAVWLDEVALKQGEPMLTLGFLCEEWKQAALLRKGYMRQLPRGGRPPSHALLQKRKARRLKYHERGFTVSLRSRKLLRSAQQPLQPIRMHLSWA